VAVTEVLPLTDKQRLSQIIDGGELLPEARESLPAFTRENFPLATGLNG